MSGPVFNQLRYNPIARIKSFRTAGMKMAPRWWIYRTRYVAFQDNSLPLPFGIRFWNSKEKRLRIGMKWRIKDRLFWPDLDYFPKVHYRYPMADMTHHTQIMTNENEGYSELFL